MRKLALAAALVLPLAARAADPDEAALVKQVIEDPLDEAAAAKLKALRNAQRARRDAALAALITGLEAHLTGRPGLAARALEKAAAEPSVEEMANRVLPQPLRALIASDRGPGGVKPAANPSGVCVYCGNTGWADCPRCGGCGVVICPDCRGAGKPPRGGVIRAPRCRGLGALPCPECKGKGVVPCTHCNHLPEEVDEPATETKPDAEARAIRQCIALARYLRAGGADFDSPAALARLRVPR